MSNKRKSSGKTDPTKRVRVEEPPKVEVEDVKTARERARLWHEQQMQLAGLRQTKESDIQKKSENLISTRSKTRNSLDSGLKPNPTKVTRRSSAVPTSTNRRRSEASNPVPNNQKSDISSMNDRNSTESNISRVEMKDTWSVNTVSPEPEEPVFQGFPTIEQRMNSQPIVMSATHNLPSIPINDSPTHVSWISLEYIICVCLLVGIILASVFRTEFCIGLIAQMRDQMKQINQILTKEYGPFFLAVVGLDYATFLSACMIFCGLLVVF